MNKEHFDKIQSTVREFKKTNEILSQKLLEKDKTITQLQSEISDLRNKENKEESALKALNSQISHDLMIKEKECLMHMEKEFKLEKELCTSSKEYKLKEMIFQQKIRTLDPA